MTKKQITAHKLANTDRAVEDLELTDLDFRLLALMVKLANGETGIVRHMQTDLAQRLGKTTRSVRYCLDRLVKFEYLEPVGQKPGKYISAYNVLGSKSGNYVPVSASVASSKVKAETTFLKAETTFLKQENSFPHSTLLNPLILPCADLDTDDRGPRQRADALGPPPETGNGLSNGMGELEPGLRLLLGEKFKWLAGVRLEALTSEVVTLSAPTPSSRANAIKHCEAAILQVSGAPELRFEIKIEIEPMRRMP